MKGRGTNDFVRMPEAEFEEILARAAEQGARRALADVGLDGNDAATDTFAGELDPETETVEGWGSAVISRSAW